MSIGRPEFEQVLDDIHRVDLAVAHRAWDIDEDELLRLMRESVRTFVSQGVVNGEDGREIMQSIWMGGFQVGVRIGLRIPPPDLDPDRLLT